MADFTDDQIKQALSAKRASIDPVGAAIKAEGLTEDHPISKGYRGIIQQESNNTKNAPTSNRGAVGISQITPSTFKGVADKGWDIGNPQHNAQAGLRYYKQQYDAADAQPEHAAAGYYGGPNALKKAQRGIPLKDPVNPNNPNTLEYGRQATADTGLVPVTNTEIAQRIAELRDSANKFATPEHAGMEHTQASTIDPMFGAELAAYKRGPAEYQRFKEGQKMGPIDRAMISGGREVDKLAAGTKELGTDIGGFIGDQWTSNYPSIFGEDASSNLMQKVNEAKAKIEADQADKDRLMKEFDASSGMGGKLAGGLGAMLPYVLSGYGAGPTLTKVGEAIARAPARALTSAAVQGRGALTRGVENLASIQPGTSQYLPTGIESALQKIGNKAKIEWTDPLGERKIAAARRLKNKESILGVGKILGSAGLGALEGGLHYDNSMGGGAVSSLLGTKIGNEIGPWLTRATNYRANDPYAQELLKWSRQEGRKNTPGTIFGNQETQSTEAGMRNSDKFSNMMHKVDEGNKIIDTRSAYHYAAGIPRNQLNTVEPSKILNQRAKLKQDFEDYEKGTVGQFTNVDRADLRSHTLPIIQNGTGPAASDANRTIAKNINDYKKRFDVLMVPPRNALGQMQPNLLTGKQFKELRSDISRDINDAYLPSASSTDRATAEALKPMREMLDNAIERGVRNKHGDVGVQDWKDLNTKYALTKMMWQHGTDKMGRFDPTKWGNYRLASDPERYLTENAATTSPGLIGLDRISKVKDMERDNAGSTLTSMGTHATDKIQETIAEKLLKPMNTRGSSSADKLMFKAYMSHWPAHTGALWMSGKKLGDPTLYTRAHQEQNQMWPNVYKDVKHIKQNMGTAWNDITSGKSKLPGHLKEWWSDPGIFERVKSMSK